LASSFLTTDLINEYSLGKRSKKKISLLTKKPELPAAFVLLIAMATIPAVQRKDLVSDFQFNGVFK
jgi:hypothetical protein